MGSTFRRAALAMALAASLPRVRRQRARGGAHAGAAGRRRAGGPPGAAGRPVDPARGVGRRCRPTTARRQDAVASGAIAAHRAALDRGRRPTRWRAIRRATSPIVEFYDPRCPYCRQMLPVLDALVRADPRVRLVYKDIPILGPASVLESRALLAAQRQGGYLRLQAALMRSAAAPTTASLRADAERQGMDGARFDRDMADPARAGAAGRQPAAGRRCCTSTARRRWWWARPDVLRRRWTCRDLQQRHKVGANRALTGIRA